MNLIMGRRQNKRQEPQAVPLHTQQQQQQQPPPHIKQTPPPPPPPPPPPCADDSWELQYCKWWGWNWVKKEHSEMNKYVSLPCEGPTRDNFPPIRCPVIPMKRVDKNTNRFKDFCNCLFSPNRRTAESLQRLYSTPSNSLIYESLCCGNQERGLDSYTCMELRNDTRNKSNKNTPNKRSQEKICKCEQEKKEKEKKKKYCTCKESNTSLSNCCNCKEKEPPKKGCNCKESKANAKKACNCKESNSNMKKCCNCKESNSNMKKCCNCKDSYCNLKMCCTCKETTCPKKCCCGCMESSNVNKKCCGCREQNVTNCCSCPKKSEQGTNSNCNATSATERMDSPCQIQPETKCMPCQTAEFKSDKTKASCECPVECTCCCHCTCRNPNAKQRFPENFNGEFTCRICKERESRRASSSIDAGREWRDSKRTVFESTRRPTRYSSVTNDAVVAKDTSERKLTGSTVLTRNPSTATSAATDKVLPDYYLKVPNINLLLSKYYSDNPKFYQEKYAHYAFTQQNCTNCKYCSPSAAGYSNQPCSITRRCSAGCPCKWGRPPPDLEMRILRAHFNPQTSSQRYGQSSQCRNCQWTRSLQPTDEIVQTQDYFPFGYDIVPRHYCCPNCGRRPSEEKEVEKVVDKVKKEKKSSIELPEEQDEAMKRRNTRLSYPAHTEAEPRSFWENLYKQKLENELFLSNLQRIPKKFPGLTDTMNFNVELAPEVDSLPDPIGVENEVNYLGKLESKIKKQLNSRILDDIYSNILSKTKKRAVDVDFSSSGDSTTESDDDLSYSHDNKHFLKTAEVLIDKILRQKTDRGKAKKKQKQKSSSRRKKNSIKLRSRSDSSEDEHLGNFNNLFDKIYKVTKKSSFNVDKPHDTVNSKERKRHHREKIKPTKSELIEKLHEIAENSVSVEDTIQNVFDILIRKNDPRRQSDNSEDLSSNSSSTSASYHAPARINYDHENPKKSHKMKLKSKIPLKKGK